MSRFIHLGAQKKKTTTNCYFKQQSVYKRSSLRTPNSGGTTGNLSGSEGQTPHFMFEPRRKEQKRAVFQVPQLACHLTSTRPLSHTSPHHNRKAATGWHTPEHPLSLLITHYISSHCAKVKEIQNTPEHSWPIPLWLQTACQGTSGTQHSGTY